MIGSGGSHANPFSGKVENGSVYQYTGNMWSYARSIKKWAQAKNEYDIIMSEIVLAKETEVDTPEEVPSAGPEVSDRARGVAGSRGPSMTPCGGS